MSIILGLNINHADSSACIFKDGTLLFAVEEERINRIKHWAGLPVESIKLCLDQTGISINEITDVTINSNPLSNILPKVTFFLKNYISGRKKYEIFQRLKQKLNLKQKLEQNFFPKIFSKNIKFHYVDHHLSHIASAFYPSKFEKAVGLSIDGFGDFCSIAIAKCEDGKISIIDKTYFPDSLGIIYEAFTQYLGFNNYGDEYKVMGLSSYGSPIYSDIIEKNIFTNTDKFKLNLDYFNHTNKDYKYKFSGSPKQNTIFDKNVETFLNLNTKTNQDFIKTQRDIASSVQNIFEKQLIKICKKINNLNFSKNLVYAGGCALNSLANKKIFESNLFEKIYIPYAPGDAGGSIGSALKVIKSKNNNALLKNLYSPYIGPIYNNNDIKSELNNNSKLKEFNIKKYENKDELNVEVAKKIFENKIVGYFNNKMEFGARALGNRSILANPCNPNIKGIINLKIKRRESFRPFAPAIIYEEKYKWFNNSLSNPYMSNVENIIENQRIKIPAVTHIDGTGRVQTVTKDINIDFYNLINEFYKLSNVPILLNTSFNENEPIVMSYKNAIECFIRTKMDVLVLNNFIIER
jgi:carbamoyltransferase